MSVAKFIFNVSWPFRYYILGCIFTVTLLAINTILSPYLLKLIINYIANTVTSDFHYVIKLATLFIMTKLGFAIFWRIYSWCELRYEPLLANNIAKTLFDKVTTHSYQFFQDALVGSLSNRISNAADYIPTIISRYIHSLLLTLLTIVFACFAFWHISFWLSLAIFTWVTLYVSLVYIGYSKFGYLSNNLAEVGTKLMGGIVDALANINNMRLFVRKKYELNTLDKNQQLYTKAFYKRGYYLLSFEWLQGLMFVIYQAISVSLLIYLYYIGEVTAGDFAMILTVNSGLVDSLWNLSYIMRENNANLGKVKQALTLLDYPYDIYDKQNALELKIACASIEFKEVSFKYPSGRVIFNKLSFTINSQEKVGLVGYSGAGKTTVINLILRLFDVLSGEILINNINIKEVTQDSLRKNISLIPQDAVLFHRSIMENIRYGREEATDEEVIEAAKQAYAHDFIVELPDGYNSLVGERGVKLSGGQRQRIAIARAFLKNAPLLILDEASSQLDLATEQLIQKSLVELMHNKTVIVIAHRLSTLLIMDRIIVFDKGEICEAGNHEYLLNSNGLYSSLWHSQMGGFLTQ